MLVGLLLASRTSPWYAPPTGQKRLHRRSVGRTERLCTAVDTSTTPSGVTAAGRTARRCNRRIEAAAAYRAGQRGVSRFNTG